MGFRVLALIVVAGLVWYALYKYHQRRGLELDQRHAKHHGWRKVVISVRHEAWICPRCRVPLLSWSDVLGHQSVESPCALLEDEQGQAAALELEQAAAADAQAAGRWSASATVGGEQHGGAVDTWAVEDAPRGELESGDSDGA